MEIPLIKKCLDFIDHGMATEEITTSSSRRLLKLFEPDIERYIFDFNLSMNDGWYQADSRQDAWYYGNWVNFDKCAFICYAEGDLYISVYHTQEQLLQVLENCCAKGDIKHIDACEEEKIVKLANGRFPVM